MVPISHSELDSVTMDTYSLPPGGQRPTGPNSAPLWLTRLLSAVVAIAILIVAIFLGGVILVTGAVLAVALWGWLWWQRRKLTKMMGEGGAEPLGANPLGPDPLRRARGQGPGRAQRGRPADENVIEGDFTVLDEGQTRADQSQRGQQNRPRGRNEE